MSPGRAALAPALLLAVAPLLVSCASGPDEEADAAADTGAVSGELAADGADEAVGCYRFDEREVGGEIRLPWGVVLEAEPLGEGWPVVERVDSVRLAHTATGPEGRTDHPFGYWRPTGPDSLEIGHPGGGGIVLRVAPSGEDLAGWAWPAGDALAPGEEPGQRPGQRVRATRVPCEGADDPAAADGPAA